MGSSKLNRRTFLQTSVGTIATTAAAAEAFRAWAADAPATVVPGPKLDARPFKVGLIGCGSQATLNLMPAALRIPGFTFTAVCDVVPERAQDAAKIASGGGTAPKIYDDYKALLKEADMDAVMIVTPLKFHTEMALEAFKNGRHVFCEKNMVYTIDECKEMLKAQMAANKVLQIGHHLRYHPLYHFAKAHYVDKGLLGKVNNIHCQWNRNGTWRREHPKYAAADYKKWGYETPDEVFNWRLYRKFSCGLMTELCSHQLDIINWFFGDKLPTVIHGVGRIDNDDSKLGPYPKRTIFDNVHLIYEFPDDIQMSYQSITTNAFSPFGEAYEMIQGERATLVMAHLSSYVGMYFLEPGASQELWMAGAQRGKFESPNARKEYGNPILLNGQPSPGSRLEKVGGIDIVELVDTTTCQLRPGWTTYQIQMYSFKQCVLDKQAPYCDGFVGIKSAVPALLGYEALEKQQPVAVDPNMVKP